jgi:hypothetical protein
LSRDTFTAAGVVVPIGTKLFSISQTEPGLLEDENSHIFTGALGENSKYSTARFSSVALELANRYEMDLDLFKDFQFVTAEDVKAKLIPKDKKVEPGRLFSEFESVALVGGGMGAEVLLERLRIMSIVDKVGGYFDVKEKNQLFGTKYLGEPLRDSIYKGFINGEFDGMLITVTSSMRFRREMLNLAEEF